MKHHRLLAGIALALAAGPTIAEPARCGLPNITSARELHQFFSLRAVEVVQRAARPDSGLAAMVAPSATFSLGRSDVGRPLGSGIDGIRELAKLMNADSYRFFGWARMDMTVDACSKQIVEVEFIDSRGKDVSTVKFTFEGGSLVSGAGWQSPFESGPL